MTNDITPHPGAQSPFDAIRRVTDEGREYWSARDLMPLLGYDRWENFAKAIARAEIAVDAQNGDHDHHFRDATKVVERSQGGGSKLADVELTRFAAYQVAMCGDPRKPEVAAALAYFAIRTREAETRPAFNPSMLSRLDILQLALNAEEELQAEKAKNAELEPKAEAYESFLDATGKYGVGAVAKMLGTSQNKLYRDLRNAGVLIPKGSMRNTPYQKYMHHFEVRAHEYERSNGEPGCSYTTYVQPSGIDFIRRRLNLPSIDPQLPAGAA